MRARYNPAPNETSPPRPAPAICVRTDPAPMGHRGAQRRIDHAPARETMRECTSEYATKWLHNSGFLLKFMQRIGCISLFERRRRDDGSSGSHRAGVAF